MMSTRQGLSLLGAVLVGAAAGLVVGLLTAPASGQETRRRMARRLEDERDDLRRRSQHLVQEAATRLEHGIETGKERIEKALSS